MFSILIMEDDDNLRKMLKAMLEVAGYKVLEAPDGEAGMKLYRLEPTDLIIIDIFMPRKEGLETIMELRRDYADVKIIAMSGGSKKIDHDFLHQSKLLGAQRTLSKPFERQELLEAIEELVG